MTQIIPTRWLVHPAVKTMHSDCITHLTDAMNIILEKNTNLRLVSSPLENQSIRPETTAAFVKDTKGFPLTIWVGFGPNLTAYAGNCNDLSALIDITAPSIPDPAHRDFDAWIYTLLHELGHVFGQGIGEMYRSNIVFDKTGEEPSLGISIVNPSCRYFGQRPDWTSCPMVRNVTPWTGFRYSDFVAANMSSGKYRVSIRLADYCEKVRLKVYDYELNPLPFTFQAWRGMKSLPFAYYIDNAESQITVPLGGTSDELTVDANRVLKVSSPGYRPATIWFTLWDLQEAAYRREEGFDLECLLLKPDEDPDDLDKEVRAARRRGKRLVYSQGPAIQRISRVLASNRPEPNVCGHGKAKAS